VTVTVVIVDDQPNIREDLYHLLSQYEDIEVIGLSDGGTNTLGQIADLQPDVVLMNSVFFGMDDLALIQQIQVQGSRSRVIVLASYDDEDQVRRVFKAGVHGYLLKSVAAARIVDTIRAIHLGEVHICTAFGASIFESRQAAQAQNVRQDVGLTDQEMQLLRLIAKGATTEEMAQDLCLSERTIKRRINHIRKQLQAHNRAEAIEKAHQFGLI
jgi:DNA-binding NarL/FixJ family response regulator